MIDISRRHTLRAASCVLFALLAGCPSIFQERYRRLGFSGIDYLETNGMSTIQFDISFTSVGGTESWRAFHDVRVVGLDTEGNVLCRESVGRIPDRDGVSAAHVEVELACDTRPDILEIRAAECPCDRDTTLGRAQWDSVDNEPSQYMYGDRECDQTETSPDIEVYRLPGHNPYSLHHPSSGQNVIEFAETNYA